MSLPQLRSFLLLSLAFAGLMGMLGCKTKSKKKDPPPPPPVSADQECGAVGLYAAASNLDSSSDLPAPSLTLEKANLRFPSAKDNLNRPAVRMIADRHKNAEIVYYRACLNPLGKNGKCANPDGLDKEQKKSQHTLEGFLFRDNPDEGAGENSVHGFRRWLSESDNHSVYTYQVYNCVQYDSVKKGAEGRFEKITLANLEFYCGMPSLPKKAALAQYPSGYIASLAKAAQQTEDYMVHSMGDAYVKMVEMANDQGFYLTGSKKSASDGDAFSSNVSATASLGYSALLVNANRPSFLAGSQFAVYKDRSSVQSELKLAEGVGAADCEPNAPPPPPPPPPVKQEDPAPPPPPPPPPVDPEPVDVPLNPSKPKPAPSTDPYAADKAECASRDQREQAILSAEEAGKWEWSVSRSVCTYKEPNGNVTMVPDVGNDPLPVCPTAKPDVGISKTNLAVGGTLIALGGVTVLATGAIGARALYMNRTINAELLKVQDGAADFEPRTWSQFQYSGKAKGKRTFGESVTDSLKRTAAAVNSGVPGSFLKNRPVFEAPDRANSFKGGYAVGEGAEPTKLQWGKLTGLGFGFLAGAGAVVAGSLLVNGDIKLDLASGPKCVPPGGQQAEVLSFAMDAGAATIETDAAINNYSGVPAGGPQGGGGGSTTIVPPAQ